LSVDEDLNIPVDPETCDVFEVALDEGEDLDQMYRMKIPPSVGLVRELKREPNDIRPQILRPIGAG